MAVGTHELQAILRGIGAPVNARNLKYLSAWQRAEGGSATFNPFNTTQGASGASDYNSVGVKNYRSNQQGIQATVQTLKNGHYGDILNVLRTGHGDFAGAVGSSPWGTSGSLLASILGGPYNPTVSSGGGPAPKAHTAGAKHSTQFDAAQFRQQAGALMLQAASATAQGQGQQVDVLGGLEAIRKAATTKVNNAAGQGGVPVAGGSGIGNKAVAIAARQIGTPYVWGGESKSGFDCSGLVQFTYSKLGINLPRTAAEQGKAGRSVSYKNIKPGDLLVENNGDHVVMYAGNGKVVAAPHTGTNVQYQPLSYFPSSQYYARRIVG